MTQSTGRENDRLFPARRWRHGWGLSLQADAAGYACSPRTRFQTLEEYDLVEVAIYGPDNSPVDPSTMGLPDSILAKFGRAGEPGVAIGAFVSHSEVAVIEDAIRRAATDPSIGVPAGTIGWSQREVFLVLTDEEADDFSEFEIDDAARGAGPLGSAIYLKVGHEEAVDAAIMAGREGEVRRFEIAEGTSVLDLRNAGDRLRWEEGGYEPMIGTPDLRRSLLRGGISAVYLPRTGELAVLEARALRLCDPRPGKRSSLARP